TQSRLLRTFHYALLPGGYLFLGTAESITRNSRLFTALDKKNRILQRRDAGGGLPEFQPQGVPALQLPSTPPRRPSTEHRTDKAVARVMQHYAPAYFVIDRNHDITRFSGAETGHYLEPSQGAANLNLFSILHKTLRPAVRAAVIQAVADGVRTVNDNLTMRIDGQARALTLIVEPIGGESGAKSSAACVVAFRDAPPTTAPHKTPQAGSDANVEALENELRATKGQLQAAIDELETRIEDMRSTTEEFQAVNEELQSSNEELETLNGEVNSKNELLTRLNSDMQNLLDNTQIATVFLDQELRIRYFTPAITQLFPVQDSDRGRSLPHIVSDVDYTALRSDVEKVQRDREVLERDLVLKNGSLHFIMRIRPYLTPENIPSGVVITFVEITERKRAEEQQQLLGRELQHRTNNLLAVIQSIAGLSLSGTHSLAQAREALTARLHALANANAVLVEANWQGASLKAVIDRELASFVSRASIEGPQIELIPSATQAFALAIHELATNAAKHGALSTPGGKVAIRWSGEERAESPSFSFSWQESGGPPV